MLWAFRSVRRGERRDTLTAFVTLFGLISSHQILETARDALFLSNIPAERLPFVYIAIAAVSLLITRFQPVESLGSKFWLIGSLVIAALITAGLYFVAPLLGDAGLYALYVWSGMLTTIILVRFWTLLGSIFTVTQAKRLYSVIGTGSVLGAIAGSAVARAMSESLPAEALLLASALGLLTTAALALSLGGNGAEASEASDAGDGDGLLESVRYVRQNPYARRIAYIVLASAATLTFVDYVFKKAAKLYVPDGELASFFATVYLVLNIVSFVAQLGLVNYILKRFDLSVALAILPVFLVIGGTTMAIGAGIVAALIIKAPDGALRYSLHRTASELLYVPLSERERGRVKAFIDVVAQKGGQGLASISILGAVALGAGLQSMSVVLALLALAWLGLAIGIRRPYLELFRNRVQAGRLTHLDEFPDLDVASLENLVAALDSQDDQEVIAALDVIEREGKTRIIPGLILYHPSADVVERALGTFARTRRKNSGPIAGRLLNHREPRVRAAAVMLRSVLEPGEAPLWSLLRSDSSPEVRAAATVNLIAGGFLSEKKADNALARIMQADSPKARVALAQAIGLRQTAGFSDVLSQLARSEEQDVRLAAIEAMGKLREDGCLEALLESLASEDTRPIARQVIAGYGQRGLEFIAEAFDPATPLPIRWQLPRTITLFAPQEAADVLLEQLGQEQNGLVRYRIIRALEISKQRDPETKLDSTPLKQAIEQNLSRAYRFVERRVAIEAAVEEGEAEKTPGFELLRRLLKDKERNTVGRLFRLLGLIHPREDFVQIHRALSGSREARASSMELIENVLQPPLRGAVLGLVDDIPDGERVRYGETYHEASSRSFLDLLRALLGSTSQPVRDMTAYWVGELRLTALRDTIGKAAEAHPSSDLSRTRSILSSEFEGSHAE